MPFFAFWPLKYLHGFSHLNYDCMNDFQMLEHLNFEKYWLEHLKCGKFCSTDFQILEHLKCVCNVCNKWKRYTQIIFKTFSNLFNTSCFKTSLHEIRNKSSPLFSSEECLTNLILCLTFWEEIQWTNHSFTGWCFELFKIAIFINSFNHFRDT